MTTWAEIMKVFEITEDELIPKYPETGFIYYNESTGAITTATLTVDESERHPHIEVPSRDVMEFLDGSRNMAGWFVIHVPEDGTMRLTSVGGTKVCLTAGEPGIFKVSREAKSSSIQFVFQLPETGRRVGVKLVKRIDLDPIIEGNLVIAVVVASVDEPENVFGRFNLDVRELIRKGYLQFEVDVTSLADVFAQTVDPIYYQVEDVLAINQPIPLPPGRFEDLAWFGVDDGEAGLIAWRENGELRLKLRDGGGRRYERELSRTKLIVCRNRDPDEFIAKFDLDLSSLENEAVASFPLPEEEFTLASQLVFEKLILIESDVEVSATEG